MFIDVGLAILEPAVLQFIERQVVAFNVIDSCDGDSARGDYAGPMPGVVRPLLKWNSVLCPDPVTQKKASTSEINRRLRIHKLDTEASCKSRRAWHDQSCVQAYVLPQNKAEIALVLVTFLDAGGRDSILSSNCHRVLP